MIEKNLKSLETLQDFSSPVYWLTLGRVFELSLYLAGHYADNGEPSAAGDLLVNPRKVLIYMDQMDRPVLKRKHSRVSDQVMELSGGCGNTNISELLLKKTITHVVEKPLLPSLLDIIEGSGQFKRGYCLSGKKRMSQVAASMGFIFSCRLKKGTSVQEYARTLDQESRQLLESNLCRFDLSLFWEMGRQIESHLSIPQMASRALARPQVFQGEDRLYAEPVTA